MIVRIWSGRASVENADAYRRFVTTKVIPAIAKLPGHRGANLLRREIDGGVEFIAVTLWDSLDAIRAFAGPDIDLAVVEPEAQARLSSFHRDVCHYELSYATTCGVAGNETLPSLL